jgi:hypothetical protein
MARCLAVAISQAPGLSGIPDSGHCSRAATRASCASSSARPTSRTIRVRAAMILPDSIRQTASMARCVGVAVTATHHTIFALDAQADYAAPRIRSHTSGVARIWPQPWRLLVGGPRRAGEFRTHRRQRLGESPSPVRWPLPWTLLAVWRSRRPIPWSP